MAKKRADGDGTLYYHDKRKRWVLQVPIGRTPSGRIQRKTFYGRTQDEVLEKRRQFWIGLEKNKDQAPEVANSSESANNDMTVNQLLDLWLDSLECEYKTLQGYKSMADNHIRPEIGDNKIVDLTPISIQLLYKRNNRNSSGTET